MLVRNFYIKDITNIAGPIILGNLGFIMIGVGDVIVAGRHSTDTLAAVSLATAIINCIMIFGIGILGSISPILSNYRGAGKEAEKYFYPSLKFAALLSALMSILIIMFIPLIDKLGFEARLVPMIKDYFWITAFSTFGAYLHTMTKEFLQAFEIVLFPNILTVICIFVNLFLNIIFCFGTGPIPEYGAGGLAFASLLTRYIMGFETAKNLVKGYVVVYDDKPQYAYYYSNGGYLVAIDVDNKQKDGIYPYKIGKYCALTGNLISIALYVSEDEQFAYTKNGKLKAHWIGDTGYNANGKPIAKRKVLDEIPSD